MNTCPTCHRVELTWKPLDIDATDPSNIAALLDAIDKHGTDDGLVVEGLCEEARDAVVAAGHRTQYIILEAGYGIVSKALLDARHRERQLLPKV